MSIKLAVVLVVVAFAGFAAAGTGNNHVSYSSGPSKAYTYMSQSSNYLWHVYKYQGKRYVYTYSTCSTPPSSIEVCLSTIFSSIEADLSLIEKSLKGHEVSIHGYMYEEFANLKTEINEMQYAKHVASSVKEALSIDIDAVKQQIVDLTYEKEQIKYAKLIFKKQAAYLEAEIDEVVEQYEALYEKYEDVKKAKWTLVSEVYAIQKQKGLIVEEEADIENVVSALYEEVEKIEVKISQMNKRQQWMMSWQGKLSVNLHGFMSEVKEFKKIEAELNERETYLKAEQVSLYEAVELIEKEILKLQVHYKRIDEYLSELIEYEKRIFDYKLSVDYDMNAFSYALSDFTCEEYVLYYEACLASSAPAAAPAAPAAAAKPAAPAAKP